MMYLVVSIIKQKKTITFYRNGVSLGVAYTNIDKKVPLYPAIDFSTQGSEIDIVKPKFKKEKKKKESDSDKSDSESEDEDELPRFQPKLGSTTVTYQKAHKIALYTGSSGWNGTALGKKAKKYSIKILGECQSLMYGFAPKTINKAGNNYTTCGYYFYLYNGCSYGQNGKNGDSFSSEYGNAIDTIYGAIYNSKKGFIEIYKNGKLLGKPHENIKGKKGLLPAFDFYEPNSKIQFVTGKFKKH